MDIKVPLVAKSRRFLEEVFFLPGNGARKMLDSAV
jgi:hypothetical protein